MHIRDRLGLTAGDWSLAYWGAVASFVGGYALLRFLGSVANLVDVPGLWVPGILVSIAALPMAPGVAEATYRARTGRATRGVPRLVMCLVGPLGFYVGVAVFAGVSIPSSLRSSLVVSAFAMVWLLVLDKVFDATPLDSRASAARRRQ